MMKTGVYYIGDLCYVLGDVWDEICDWMYPKGGSSDSWRQGEYELSDGRRIANYRTKWGDGVYKSNIDTDYMVDSGTIGCIDTSNLKLSIDELIQLQKLGALVEFRGNFLTHGCDYKNDGIIRFGHVEIST